MRCLDQQKKGAELCGSVKKKKAEAESTVKSLCTNSHVKAQRSWLHHQQVREFAMQRTANVMKRRVEGDITSRHCPTLTFLFLSAGPTGSEFTVLH